MRARTLVFLTVLSFVVACGGDDAGRADSTVDDAGSETLDVVATDAVPDSADTLLDATPPLDRVEPAPDLPADPGEREPEVLPDPTLSCTTLPRLDVAYDLLPGEPITQIHGVLGFDGAAVWAAYNVPDPESSYFDVRVARLWCDGSYATPPALAHSGPLANDIDPDLAMGPSSALVAWYSDTGGSPNLFIYTRGYHLDGTPVVSAERPLDLVLDGAPLAASAWLPKVAALPDGSFAVVGAWADPLSTTWQVFLAYVGADGALLPPRGSEIPAIVRLASEPGVGQFYPDVAVDDDGTIVVAWTRSVSDADGEVRVARVGLDGVVSVPETASTGVADGAALAASGVPGAKPWLAWFRLDANAAIDLARIGAAPGAATSFGETWAFDHSPVLAPTAWGGAIAWYRVRNGVWNDFLIQAFDGGAEKPVAQGSALVLNPVEGDVEHAAASVYGPALTHIRDRVFLAAWSEGKSPDFSLVGRFVELP